MVHKVELAREALESLPADSVHVVQAMWERADGHLPGGPPVRVANVIREFLCLKVYLVGLWRRAGAGRRRHELRRR